MGKKKGLEAWKDAALALPAGDYEPRLPIHVLTGEAVDLSQFVEARWDSKMRGKTLDIPGLDSTKKKLERTVGADLLSQGEALQQAHTAYLLTARGGGDVGLHERGAFLVNELEAALEWLFDDGVEDEKDAQLAAVKQEHADDQDSHDALASELEDYASLADEHRDDLDGAGGFDAAHIDESREVAGKLRALPSAGKVVRSPETAAALDLRNRIAFILLRTMNLVRGQAKYVFRNHPAIAREATSAYERRKRAAARRAAKKEKEEVKK